MDEVFLKILNMSLSSVWIVLAVVLVRAVFRHAPKRIFPILWGLVGLRLLLPVTFKTPLSLVPSAKPLPDGILTSPAPAVDTGFSSVDGSLNRWIFDSLAPGIGDSVNPMQVLAAVGGVLWISGIALMLGYALVSTAVLKHRLRDAEIVSEGVKRSPFCPTAFVLGFIHPVVYLPEGIGEDLVPFVLDHERAHIRRGDHRIKPLAFLLLAVHWFNPFLWLAYLLLCRDIEMACDEQVVKDYAPSERAAYSESLLACSLSRRRITACPLAFGEVSVKNRVKRVLSYKNPAFWAIALSAVTAVLLAVCFLTDPPGAKNPAVGDYIPGISRGNVDTGKFTAVSPDFAVGADKNGYAVFKDPEKAYSTFLSLYGDTLGEIRERNHLAPLSERTLGLYMICAAETERSDAREREKYSFVAAFLDIYENSVDPPSPGPDVPPTVSSEGMLGKTEVPDRIWTLAAAKAKTRSVTIRREEGMSRKADGGTLYVFPTEETGPSITVLDGETPVAELSLTDRIFLDDGLVRKSGFSSSPEVLRFAAAVSFDQVLGERAAVMGNAALRQTVYRVDGIGDAVRIDPDGASPTEAVPVYWRWGPAEAGEEDMTEGEPLWIILGTRCSAETGQIIRWFDHADSETVRLTGEKYAGMFSDPAEAMLWEALLAERYRDEWMGFAAVVPGSDDESRDPNVWVFYRQGLTVTFENGTASPAPVLKYILGAQERLAERGVGVTACTVRSAVPVASAALSENGSANALELWEIDCAFSSESVPSPFLLRGTGMTAAEGTIAPEQPAGILVLIRDNLLSGRMASLWDDGFSEFLPGYVSEADLPGIEDAARMLKKQFGP